jgi:pimeloyl-ACP methyl ester carboxylesterase
MGDEMNKYVSGTLYLGLMFAWLGPPQSIHAQDPSPVSLQTTDYMVPHISTVPATAGDHVELFVRETVRLGRHRDRPAVLMVHGTTQSTVTGFDLRFENYSWMDYLARAGFDVFAMDLTGYGLSPRPRMDDPCNNATSDQQSSLIPKPLAQPCSPSYPFHLTTSQSDWDEIDTVVEYIRQRRGVDKVNLIGWSLGGPRMGGYAARHPEKVDKLLLYAPLYNRLEPSDPPVVLPEPGVPLTVRTISSVFSTWDTQVKCTNQFTPAIRKALGATILEFDPLGKTWGTEDLWRSPIQNTRWGVERPSCQPAQRSHACHPGRPRYPSTGSTGPRSRS